ncbi:MAG: YdbH domain-containing protein [Bdellovibrionales bacterium]
MIPSSKLWPRVRDAVNLAMRGAAARHAVALPSKICEYQAPQACVLAMNDPRKIRPPSIIYQLQTDGMNAIMTFRMRFFICVLGISAALIALALVLVPWKPIVEERVKAILEARGFQNARFTVTDIGFKNIALQDISAGEPPSLHVKNLMLSYSLVGLLSGSLGEVILGGLDIEAREEGGRWTVKGLEGLAPKEASSSGSSVPFDLGAMIPFERARLEASLLRLSTNAWNLTVPLDVAWRKKPQPALVYRARGLAFKASPLEINTGESTFSLAPDSDKKKWKGPWRIKDIAVIGLETPMPSLESVGEVSIGDDFVMATGSLKSHDGAYASEFKLLYSLAAADKSNLTLISAAMPWNGGKISVQNVVVPLAVKRDISFPVIVENVSVDALMQSLTGKQASGTGAVSGTLPMTIRADGRVLINKGNLRADAPGKIALSPESIPGDNQQIALVREILKDLHYTLLSMTMETGPDQQSSILMSLEGLNPSVYEGRPVKLNVRLTGDVLNLVQQSIMPLLDPALLLRQDKHEKN